MQKAFPCHGIIMYTPYDDSCILCCRWNGSPWAPGYQQQTKQSFMNRTYTTGIILYMRPAKERRRYNVTSSLIGGTHIQNDPCITSPEELPNGAPPMLKCWRRMSTKSLKWQFMEGRFTGHRAFKYLQWQQKHWQVHHESHWRCVAKSNIRFFVLRIINAERDIMRHHHNVAIGAIVSFLRARRRGHSPS